MTTETISVATQEAQPINPVVAPQEEVPNPLAEHFQKFTKQEKHLASERKRIEEAKQQFEAEKQFAEAYKSLKNKNPFDILEHFGVTYEKLLEADKERASPVDPAIKRALDKVQELELKMTQKEREAEDARIAKVELELKSEIEDHIKQNEYDLIEALDAKDAVKEFMEETYELTGEIPTVEEACKAINQSLIDRLSKVSNSKWLKPQEPPPTLKVEPEIKAVPTPKKTITNKMTQTSTVSTEPLSEAERLQEAIRIMKFKK